jgi:hypothetical protein
MSLAVSYEASYINRAAAIYRHIAGIPTDQEAPGSPLAMCMHMRRSGFELDQFLCFRSRLRMGASPS